MTEAGSHTLPPDAVDPEIWRTRFTAAQLEAVVSELTGSLLECRGGKSPSVPFTLDGRDPDGVAGAAMESLTENGIVVFERFVDADTVDRIAERMQAALAPLRPTLAARETGETDRYLIQIAEEGPLRGYPAVAGYPKTVFNIRTSLDKGMVDAFNIDRLFEDGLPEAQAMRPDWLRDLLERATGLAYQRRNLNAYFNAGVPETRGFHADSYTPQVKAFLYLTDVADDADGPHYYVLGSHDDEVARALNRRVNRLVGITYETEMRLFDRSRIARLTAPRGTLILSFQSGIHRGGPQLDGHERLVLVQNFMVPGT